MKKITLLALFMGMAFLNNAQETISFEAPDYSLGDITGQNGWIGTPTGETTNLENQVVSDEQSTDGTYSLKIVKEDAFASQDQPVIGAFYNYATPVPNALATFSADLYIDEFNSNSSDFIFGLVNTTVGSFRTYVRFTFAGNISVLGADAVGTVTLEDTMIDWTPLTWFNIRVEITGNVLEVFKDGTSIYTGFTSSTGPIDQMRFAHDNFDGFAYMDNFRTNDENLSVEAFDTDAFTHFYNKTSNTLNLASLTQNLQTLEIIDLLGKRVLFSNLNTNEAKIDVASLNEAIYIAKITTEQGGTKTIKFLKN